MSEPKYGQHPGVMGSYPLNFREYMHYMYLPIVINEPGKETQFSLPANLEFAAPVIEAALTMEANLNNRWKYVYVTARRGYATPGNPLNRPGWHTDGFGTNDINYVWVDKYPTEFAIGQFEDISDDHVVSAAQFHNQALDMRLVTYPNNTLLRLDSNVVHAAPRIPAPGGERSFFKVSFSNDRYNLFGNSRNFELDYRWPMYTRESVRNDPNKAGQEAS